MRNFTVIDCEQRTDAWRRARAGRLTASDAGDVFAANKSGTEAAKRKDLRTRLVVERLTGEPQYDDYINQWVQRGIDYEADARAAFEAATGILVQLVGFVAHNELLIGCSPDGSIDGLIGGLEIKVPKLTTHIGYLRGGGLPVEYKAQVAHSMLVTDAEFWDFVSFAPELPEPLRLFHVRVTREQMALETHDAGVRKFLAEVQTELDALTTMTNLRGQLEAAIGA